MSFGVEASTCGAPLSMANTRFSRRIQLIGLGSAGTVKGEFAANERVGTIQEQHVQVRVEVEGRAESMDKGDSRLMALCMALKFREKVDTGQSFHVH